MSLVDFLLARIAEDEAWAQEAIDFSNVGVTREWRWVRLYGNADRPKLPSSSSFHGGAPSPARVLAECAAKRRIVEAHHWEEEWEDGLRFASDCADCRQSAPCHTLRILATVYSDHADYRAEWAPEVAQ